jgi:hypothetical protein
MKNIWSVSNNIGGGKWIVKRGCEVPLLSNFFENIKIFVSMDFSE